MPTSFEHLCRRRRKRRREYTWRGLADVPCRGGGVIRKWNSGIAEEGGLHRRAGRGRRRNSIRCRTDRQVPERSSNEATYLQTYLVTNYLLMKHHYVRLQNHCNVPTNLSSDCYCMKAIMKLHIITFNKMNHLIHTKMVIFKPSFTSSLYLLWVPTTTDVLFSKWWRNLLGEFQRRCRND